MTKTTEFKNWLTRNEAHLKSYSTDELINVAIAAGFDRSTVAQYMTHLRFEGVSRG